MSDKAGDEGSTLGALLKIALLGCFVYAGAWWVVPWVFSRDAVFSACPRSGVSNIVTHGAWGGVDWTVTCLDGTRVHISNGGNSKALPVSEPAG